MPFYRLVCSRRNHYMLKMQTHLLYSVSDRPSISILMSNTSDVIQTDNVTVTCDVDSNPESEIKFYNMTDNTTLETINSDNKAKYQFVNIHCLDAGEYMFTARNDIPHGSYVAHQSVFINVMCMFIIIVYVFVTRCAGQS